MVGAPRTYGQDTLAPRAARLTAPPLCDVNVNRDERCPIMRTLGRILLRGLAVVVPAVLTIYALYYLASIAESMVKWCLERFSVQAPYVPGMGVALVLATVFVTGLLTYVWIVRRFVALAEDVVLRVPLVGTVYGGLRDLMQFVSSSEGRAGRAVAVEDSNGFRLVGLVTCEDLGGLPEGMGGPDTVAVFLPMSYQMGGFTVLVPRAAVKTIDMSAEEALRFALTAGMSASGARRAPGAGVDSQVNGGDHERED